MKHLRTFFLSGIVITAIAFLWGCSQNQPGRNVSTNVKYYRNILFSETPWDIERGSRELTPGQAAEINSYKFTYDDEGRLLSVEFSRNDELLGYSAPWKIRQKAGGLHRRM